MKTLEVKKTLELFNKIFNVTGLTVEAKQCTLIAVENEYNSLREQLFNLRVCTVIESEKVYLKRLDILIEEEKEIKQEIEKL